MGANLMLLARASVCVNWRHFGDTMGRSFGGRAEPITRNGEFRLTARWRALQHRNFRLFFAGQLASLIGTWMQSAAQLWLVYRLTGSAALLGVFGFANQIPIFLLAPVGGMVADSYSKHKSVIWTQASAMVLAFLLAALTLTGTIRVWEIIAIAFLAGIVNAFDVPIRQAFLNDMVEKDDLMNAIALNSSIFNAARVVRPAGWGFGLRGREVSWAFPP